VLVPRPAAQKKTRGGTAFSFRLQTIAIVIVLQGAFRKRRRRL
jgi:hypothetical protein